MEDITIKLAVGEAVVVVVAAAAGCDVMVKRKSTCKQELYLLLYHRDLLL